jgi:hypothetical protein
MVRTKRKSEMKTIFATVALLMAFNVAASAQAVDQRAREYRMWSAEQMVNRLIDKYARSTKACDRVEVRVWMPRLSEECKAAVIGAYPILSTIRNVARSGTEVQWANIIDIVHKMEVGIEGPLNDLERK